MNEAQGVSNALPPFITKTYEMVDDPSTDAIVSWSQSRKSFIVRNPPEFAGELLPKFFKHNNFSSFIRQLNTYGFRKIDPEQWEFANEDFIRGQPHLLKNIHRRKPVHSHSMQNLQGQRSAASSPLTESERRGYSDEIERLQYEKESLQAVFHQHKQEQEGIESQVHALIHRLQNVEHAQKDILSSIGDTMQKPYAGSDFAQLETNERKRRLSSNDFLYDEANPSASFHVLNGRHHLSADSLLLFSRGILEQLETSLTFWDDIVRNVDEAYIYQRPSLELDESAACADSPAISYPQLAIEMESSCKTSEIDMNAEPTSTAVVPEITSLEKRASEIVQADTQPGVNDVFWEQFLTENPGATNKVVEIQSERNDDGRKNGVDVETEKKDIDGRKNGNKTFEQLGKFWWNMRSVNNLMDQLGHLTPAERT